MFRASRPGPEGQPVIYLGEEIIAKHLLLLHIGPVQEFIQSARRCRDLWFGSWLLSDLSREAALAVARINGLDSLIFPAPENLYALDEKSSVSVANRIMATVDNPAETASVAKLAIETRLNQHFDDVAKRLSRYKGAFDEKSARQQVSELLDFYWASLSLEGVSYTEARQELDGLLAARKNTKHFGPVTWGSSRPKSSLDGQRETVLQLNDSRASELQRESLGLRAGEKLCGVGLLKRLSNPAEASREPAFSTSHVASLAFQECLAESWEQVQAYADSLIELGVAREDVRRNGAGLDGHIFFEERLVDLFPDASPGLKLAQEELRSIYRKVGSRPSPYYAILVADGDSMGAALDSCAGIPEHQALSRSLAAFAAEATSVVKAHSGYPVYTGGDDVLALLPLHTALDCSAELARCFRTSTGYTLSVGLAVNHHIDPLSESLGLARKAERMAKSVEGKNSLAIILNKRSGGETAVCGQWGKLDSWLVEASALFSQSDLPTGLAYELRDLGVRLDGPTIPRELIRAEAQRIIRRKQAHGSNISDTTRTEIQHLQGELDLKEFSSRLIIAKFFTTNRATRKEPSLDTLHH